MTTVSVGRFATVPFDGSMNVNAPSGNVPEMLEVNTSNMRTVPRAATSVASVLPDRVRLTLVFWSAVLKVFVAYTLHAANWEGVRKSPVSTVEPQSYFTADRARPSASM